MSRAILSSDPLRRQFESLISAQVQGGSSVLLNDKTPDRDQFSSSKTSRMLE